MGDIDAYLYQIMKFLCLNMWLKEVCKDDAKDDDARSTKQDCFRIFVW